MLTGLPPFFSKNKVEIYDNIKYSNPSFYNFHKEDAVDLMSKLLEKDPAERLGSRGAEEIKGHPFFSKIDWKAMML